MIFLQKVDKLQESLHFIGDAPKAKHTVFVDTKEEAESFKPVEFFDTVPELVDKPHRRLRKAQLQEGFVVGGRFKDIQRVEKETVARYNELKSRIERRDKIAKWESKLDLKRKLLVRISPLFGIVFFFPSLDCFRSLYLAHPKPVRRPPSTGCLDMRAYSSALLRALHITATLFRQAR